MRKPVKLLAKYGLLFFAALFGGMLLTWGLAKLLGGDDALRERLVVPAAVSGDDVPRGIGGAQFDYRNPETRTPQGLDEELDATPIQLIPERQTEPLPVKHVTVEERAALGRLARDFLRQWETYSAAEGYGAYAQRLAPYVVPGRLDEVSRRLSNHQPPQIGPCGSCTTGSALSIASMDPGDHLVVRRSDDESAWVTTQATVAYAGRSVYDGQQVRRSYALVLERTGSTWRVARAASDTLAQE